MDVFDLRDRLIADYRRYVQSFMVMRDERIVTRVAENLDKLWPDPSIGLNPAFEPGGYVDELADEGLLDDRCRRVFRVGKSLGDPAGRPMRLHQHQVDAIRAAATGESYVLTTGTGSGKSLAYMVPIVDHVLRQGSGRSIKAIVVYPMNALANSQQEELAKFLNHGFGGERPVRVERYTGQDSPTDRERILADPPDVILTNYVMLELILTRIHDQRLVRAAEGLQFLVLDELHTYRGRQGADVALLVRRVREACNAPNLQCVGTSATLATEGSYTERQEAVATVAGRIFGTPVRPENVIGETLRRATRAVDLDDPAVRQALTERVRRAATSAPTTHAELIVDPLSSWIESTFGVDQLDDRLVRKVPRPIAQAPDGARSPADDLAALTGEPADACAGAIEAQLLAGNRIPDPETGAPAFAFRLHQFISKGDTVYASLGPGESSRNLTLKGGRFVPGHQERRLLLPLAFCRTCGQDYYLVTKHTGDDDQPTRFESRDIGDHVDRGGERTGFLALSEEVPLWPDDEEKVKRRLPEDWLEETASGTRVHRDFRRLLPQSMRVAEDGRRVDVGGTRVWWVPTPFRLCLHCGVSYAGTQRSDLAKLATLGTEGRSTATTVTSLSTVRTLRADESLEREARKLLSFTDNRQDASLQAGHFNDFVQGLQLRGALYRALQQAGEEGLQYDRVAQQVFASLALPFAAYAFNPDAEMGAPRRETDGALRDVLGYHVYRDLARGWRLTSPNLEQCDLLRVEYIELDEAAATEHLWAGAHPAVEQATVAERRAVVKTLLDHLRQVLAIKVDYLDTEYQERLSQRSGQRLTGPWKLDEDVKLTYATSVVPRSRQPREPRDLSYVSSRSGFGRYLRRTSTFASYDGPKLRLTDTEDIIRQLFEGLVVAGLVEPVDTVGGTPVYQLPAAAMVLHPGDGTRRSHDPVRMPTAPDRPLPINEFFLDLYQAPIADLQGVEGREHTAQVRYEDREQREAAFRRADLPVLYCSPTMELGVDIADLNVVGMRNVPPTPANYAQRSGRAGRSGQPALVMTYCSSGSPHDRWYFERPQLMVAGQVSLPRLDLANEDLVRSHVHAVWLATSGLSLGTSLVEVLDVPQGSTEATISELTQAHLHNPAARHRAREAAERMLAGLLAELERTSWWGPGWLDDVLNAIPQSFAQATQRWRSLYRSAMTQFQAQNRVIGDVSASALDRTRATQLRRQAEAQIDLLRATDNGATQSDFYSYRYFASEGFLPGYSFPRLPLSAFIPARRTRSNREGEFLSRPRFLAINEFGPGSLVYHEGNRYRINRVILPVADDRDGSGDAALTVDAKQCEHCGYLHAHVALSADRCENCDTLLPPPYHGMLRMQNVSTVRRARINSDEEERQREGFEIRTAFRFAERNGRLSARPADLVDAGGNPVGTMTYGDTVTLWRINVGRRRRADRDRLGYLLDIDKGEWIGKEAAGGSVDASADDTSASPDGVRARRVLPFVEDTRNCLVVELAAGGSPEVMASVQTALKHAIQLEYQLEDGELAAEPLPSRQDRRLILLYESAEGGAGVLRRLVEEPEALAAVARRALGLCHFDPDSGVDLRPPTDQAGCVAACYDCLLSYRNQLDHPLLDRQLAVPTLLQLAGATVQAGAGGDDVETLVDRLHTAADSELERRWLARVRSDGYRLPDASQVLIEQAATRPDFVYEEQHAAVYIDGPIHDFPSRQSRDADQTARLRDQGYTVIRFGHTDDWAQTFDTFGWVFGDGHGPGDTGGETA